MSETASPSTKRLRRVSAALVLVVLPLLGCAPTTNDPDAYGPVTEANVLDGCIRGGRDDPGDSRVVEVDDQGDDDESNDEVVYTEQVPAAERDPCQCLYDGIVEQIEFSDFKGLDPDYTDLVEAGDGGSDSTTTTTPAQKKVSEIAADCNFPPS